MKRIAIKLAICMLCMSLTGCFDFPLYDMEPVNVHVIDAETEKLIAGATVSISYIHPELIIFNHPEGTAGTTDQDGRVELLAADYDYGSVWVVKADGFLDRWSYAQNDERVPTEHREAELNGVESAVIRLYREPRPVILFVVPNEYRGLIKLEWVPTERVVVGQREFIVNVDDEGHGRVDASPILSREYPQFEARYADGTHILQPSQRYDDVSAIALWQVANLMSDNRWLWLIGTKAEDDTYSEQLHRDGRADVDEFNRMWR